MSSLLSAPDSAVVAAAAPAIHGAGQAGIIFDAVPIEDAESFLLLIVIYSICLGMVVLEFFSHIGFDIQLIRKPGWTDPAKFVSRTAYLLVRTCPAAFLSLVLVYLTTQFDNCSIVPLTFNILAMIILDSVLLIFLQRTMALYSWKRKVVVPLTVMYCIVFALSCVSLPQLGVGRRIPNSRYCAYDTRRDLTRILVVNIVYKSSSMILDFTLLIMTMHRLVDGGLKSLFTGRKGINTMSHSDLSSFLLRQGLHFYGLQTATEIVFISIYFSTQQVSYQVLGSALLLSIPPITAGNAFREMGKKASTVTQKRHVNEIINSSTNNTSQNGGTGGGGIGIGGQTMSRSERRRASTILEEGGDGMTTSMHGSNRYSSDLADPDAMEMRRQRSKDGRTGRAAADTALSSKQSSPSLDGRLPPVAAAAAAASSPWVPQTPESPYPTAWNSFMHGETAFEPVTVPPSSLSPPSRYRSPVQAGHQDDAPWRAL
ncbi:uncharacterized protein PFL1_06562 [Pseudozyma flocculosa PF-1]|uniref:Uncharacterized protein n=1 Tax=Pseudozyma flocculosa PF-1 TaxID=1277687 RepID=A0A061H100_9BASI|nr:uncharacterized protein PFL1_06562 [Pseudozyma flocculosa PF-1]EPQ25888.1 hypothetical protein PFL1_06562 [Pseudozyma flocculosa PF-1]